MRRKIIQYALATLLALTALFSALVLVGEMEESISLVVFFYTKLGAFAGIFLSYKLARLLDRYNLMPKNKLLKEPLWEE